MRGGKGNEMFQLGPHIKDGCRSQARRDLPDPDVYAGVVYAQTDWWDEARAAMAKVSYFCSQESSWKCPFHTWACACERTERAQFPQKLMSEATSHAQDLGASKCVHPSVTGK